MAGPLQGLSDWVKTLAGDWSGYTVVGSFLLYVVGYLSLRFHLTVIGIGTDLAVLDERYLFTGTRFLVYLVSSVPNIVLVTLPLALIAWTVCKLLPERTRARLWSWVMQPTRLAVFGIVVSVIMIQFVMRQCFVFNDLLL